MTDRRDNQPTVVYQPDTRQKTGFFVSLFFMFKNIIRSRELIWQLFKRDFLAVHRKSFLGMSWIVLGPIFGILAWVFMNATGVLNPGEVGIPYPAYVLLGTTFWGLFMSVYQMTSETLSVAQGFIMQVKYPHESLLVKQIMQALANFVITFVVIAVVLLLFRVTPSWTVILLPLAVIPMVLLAAAIGLFVSTVGVVAVEVKKVLDVVLSLLVFFTPIIYAENALSGGYAKAIAWNPLTHLVGGVRDLVAYGHFGNSTSFFWSALLAATLFAVSWRMFYVTEEKVVEKML